MDVVNGEEQAEYDEGQEEYLRIMIPFAVGLRLLFAIFFCLFCLIDVLSAGRRAPLRTDDKGMPYVEMG